MSGVVRGLRSVGGDAAAALHAYGDTDRPRGTVEVVKESDCAAAL